MCILAAKRLDLFLQLRPAAGLELLFFKIGKKTSAEDRIGGDVGMLYSLGLSKHPSTGWSGGKRIVRPRWSRSRADCRINPLRRGFRDGF